MKHVLLALLLFAFSCSTNSDKALTLEESKSIALDSVEAYLKKGMNDPSSYEAVNTDFKPYIVRDSLIKASSILFDRSFGKSIDSSDYYKGKSFELDTMVLSLNPIHDKALYYNMIHTFRGKNAFGALVLNSYRFTLDKNFNIIEAKPLTD